jgi:hypothetical protein
MPGLFPPFDLPGGVISLMKDQLAAPEDFILHQTLAIQLRERRKPSFLALEGWQLIALSKNMNLHFNFQKFEFSSHRLAGVCRHSPGGPINARLKRESADSD